MNYRIVIPRMKRDGAAQGCINWSFCADGQARIKAFIPLLEE